MTVPLYTTDILRLAASLPIETSLPSPDGRGERRAATCGSRIVAEVMLDGAGQVSRVAQQVQACAFGQASAALVQAAAIGRTVEELGAERNRLAAWLSGAGEAPESFEVLAPARSKAARHGAMLLPFDAVIAAVEASLDFARNERNGGGDSVP